MKGTKDNIQDSQAAWLRADITPEQRMAARKIAKQKGMTFQGWLGQLIERELTEQQGAIYGNPNHH